MEDDVFKTNICSYCKHLAGRHLNCAACRVLCRLRINIVCAVISATDNKLTAELGNIKVYTDIKSATNDKIAAATNYMKRALSFRWRIESLFGSACAETVITVVALVISNIYNRRSYIGIVNGRNSGRGAGLCNLEVFIGIALDYLTALVLDLEVAAANDNTSAGLNNDLDLKVAVCHIHNAVTDNKSSTACNDDGVLICAFLENNNIIKDNVTVDSKCSTVSHFECACGILCRLGIHIVDTCILRGDKQRTAKRGKLIACAHICLAGGNHSTALTEKTDNTGSASRTKSLFSRVRRCTGCSIRAGIINKADRITCNIGEICRNSRSFSSNSKRNSRDKHERCKQKGEKLFHKCPPKIIF